jgi:hypothetical protein
VLLLANTLTGCGGGAGVVVLPLVPIFVVAEVFEGVHDGIKGKAHYHDASDRECIANANPHLRDAMGCSPQTPSR